MRASHVELMGPDFTAQLPTLMQENLAMHALLRRVLAEVPQIGNSALASEIRAVIAQTHTNAPSTTRLSR